MKYWAPDNESAYHVELVGGPACGDTLVVDHESWTGSVSLRVSNRRAAIYGKPPRDTLLTRATTHEGAEVVYLYFRKYVRAKKD